MPNFLHNLFIALGAEFSKKNTFILNGQHLLRIENQPEPTAAHYYLHKHTTENSKILGTLTIYCHQDFVQHMNITRFLSDGSGVKKNVRRETCGHYTSAVSYISQDGIHHPTVNRFPVQHPEVILDRLCIKQQPTRKIHPILRVFRLHQAL